MKINDETRMVLADKHLRGESLSLEELAKIQGIKPMPLADLLAIANPIFADCFEENISEGEDFMI